MLVVELNSDIGIDNLICEIICRACIDYQEALVYLRGKSPSTDDDYLAMTRQKNECEAFFEGEFYEILTVYFETKCGDGELVKRTIRSKYYNRPIRWGTD